MNLKSAILLWLIILVGSCTLPRQPLLTLKEKEVLSNLALKCHCQVERSYTSSYLRYRQKGDYIISFKRVPQKYQSYIADSGYIIARYIYNELLKNDTNIAFVRYQIIDSMGNNTFKNTYYEYKTDSLLNTK